MHAEASALTGCATGLRSVDRIEAAGQPFEENLDVPELDIKQGGHASVSWKGVTRPLQAYASLHRAYSEQLQDVINLKVPG